MKRKKRFFKLLLIMLALIGVVTGNSSSFADSSSATATVIKETSEINYKSIGESTVTNGDAVYGWTTSKFTLKVNGNSKTYTAMCTDPGLYSPLAIGKSVSYEESTAYKNETVAKILYYTIGSGVDDENNPLNNWIKTQTYFGKTYKKEDQYWLIGHIAVSKELNKGKSNSTWNYMSYSGEYKLSKDWQNQIAEFIAWCEKNEIPSDKKVECTYWKSSDASVQNLITYNEEDIVEEKTSILIMKSALVLNETAAEYPVSGAKYTFYKTEEDAKNRTNGIKTVTIGTNGRAYWKNVEVSEDTTYYVRETKAPEHYKLSDAYGKVEITAKADGTYKTTYNVKWYTNYKYSTPITLSAASVDSQNVNFEEIAYDPDDIKVIKKTTDKADTTEYPLSNAVFSLTYYGDDSDCIEGQNVSTKVAYYVTDENGQFNVVSDWKESITIDDVTYKSDEILVFGYSSTTDLNGFITLTEGKKGLPTGYYLIQEVKAPDGYAKSDDVCEIEVYMNGTISEHRFITNNSFYKNRMLGDNGSGGVTFTDEPTGIYFSKKQADTETVKGTVSCDDLIADAEYYIYKKGTNGTYTKIINIKTEKEPVWRQLSQGDYYLIEATSPDGFLINNKKIYFTLSDENVSEEIKAEDSPTTYSLNLYKYVSTITGISGSVSESKAGAYTFTTGYKKADSEVTVKITAGSDIYIGKKKIYSKGETVKSKYTFTGSATLSGLGYGTYIITEIDAPTGYLISSSQVKVEIDKSTKNESKDVKIYDEQKEMRVSIHKKDAETGNALSGGLFGLYCETDITGTVSGTIKAGEPIEVKKATDGSIYFSTAKYLPFGKYYVKEIKAPTGYELSENNIYNIDFNVNVATEAHTVFEYTFENTQKYGSLVLTKLGYTLNKETGVYQATAIQTPEGAEKGCYKLYAAEDIYSADGMKKKYDANAYITTIYLDSNGIGKADKLYEGRYYLVEAKAPDGYNISTEKIYVTIKPNETVSTTYATAYDSKMPVGSLEIDKVGRVYYQNTSSNEIEVKKELEGVSFNIVLEQDLFYRDVNGDYITVDAMYQMSAVDSNADDAIYWDGEQEGQNADGTIYWDSEGYVYRTFTYVDKNGNSVTKAAKKGTIVYTGTTDENGRIIVDNLPVDGYTDSDLKVTYYETTYKIEEKSTPDGYKTTIDSEEVTFDEDNLSITKEIVNNSKELVINLSKVNESNAILKDGVFGLYVRKTDTTAMKLFASIVNNSDYDYTYNGKLNYTVSDSEKEIVESEVTYELIAIDISDEKGLFDFGDLGQISYGVDYYVKELKAPTGYIKQDGIYELSEDNFSFKNGNKKYTVSGSITNYKVQIGHTYASNNKDTILKTGYITNSITLYDNVYIKGLTSEEVKDHTYLLKGKLMDKDTGEIAKDSNGNELWSETVVIDLDEAEFIYDEENDISYYNVKVPFTFNSTGFEGKTLVMYEYLYEDLDNNEDISDNELINSDENINNTDETISFPDFSTVLSDKRTSLNGGSDYNYVSRYTPLTDTITFKNLIKGETYTVKSYIYDNSSKKLIDGVLATYTFTATGEEETVKMEMTVDTLNYAEKRLTAFEYLYDANDNLVYSEENPDDDNQSIILKANLELPVTGSCSGLVMYLLGILLVTFGIILSRREVKNL